MLYRREQKLLPNTLRPSKYDWEVMKSGVYQHHHLMDLTNFVFKSWLSFFIIFYDENRASRVLDYYTDLKKYYYCYPF